MTLDPSEFLQFAILTLIALVGFFTRQAWTSLEASVKELRDDVQGLDHKVTRLEVEMDRQ